MLFLALVVVVVVVCTQSKQKASHFLGFNLLLAVRISSYRFGRQ